MELITAEEARKKVQSGESEKAKSSFEKVVKLINQAIEDEKYGICLDGDLPSSVVKKLKDLGYTVQCGSQRNESYTSISW